MTMYNKVSMRDGTYVHARIDQSGSQTYGTVDGEWVPVERIGEQWYVTDFLEEIRNWGVKTYSLRGEPVPTVRILKMEYVDDDDEWEVELSVSSLNTYPVVRFCLDDVYGLLLVIHMKG